MRRPRLSRRQVLSAALDLVDRDGATALTMRALGRELGVEAMSLYHHVRNREDLLDGLADTMVAAELPVPPTDQAWDDALAAFGRGIRQAALRHPAAFRLVGLRPLRSTAALTSIGALLERLGADGLSTEVAVAAYRLTAAYARGYALAELGGLTLGQSREALDALPARLAPYVPFLASEPDVMFDQGLALVVAGVRAGLPSDRQAGATVSPAPRKAASRATSAARRTPATS